LADYNNVNVKMKGSIIYETHDYLRIT